MLSNIADTVSTNLQVQVEQFSDLFQDKLNCSTDTLVVAFSIFGKNESQKMLLAHIVKLARILSGYNCLKWNGILGDGKHLGVHWIQSDAITYIQQIFNI